MFETAVMVIGGMVVAMLLMIWSEIGTRGRAILDELIKIRKGKRQ